MMSTDLVRRSFDLTRAPDDQWNEEMVKLVASQVLRGTEVTKGELYFCLAVADGLNLNPFVGEVYFIPGKSRDGAGPRLTPYIGRTGLVKKADEQDCYYEAETVCEHDKFRMSRKRDGTVEVTHSYGVEDRGGIKGAYAFLHERAPGVKPAFAYAAMSEYMPTFDQDWKMDKSPWGNQTSAMIEKCAMIKAGRKRLQLGNVLADGEIERVQQMNAITGPQLPPPPAGASEFSWESLPVGEDVLNVLQEATVGWAPAKLEMVLSGLTADELAAKAGELLAESRAAGSRSPEPDAPLDGEPVPEPDSPPAAGSESEAVQNAVVVPDEEHIAALEARVVILEDTLNDPTVEDREREEAGEELERVNVELAAARNPDQGKLL